MYDEEYAYTGRWDAVLIFELSSIEAGRQAGRQAGGCTYRSDAERVFPDNRAVFAALY